MDINEVRGKLDERRKQLAEIFEQAGPTYDMSKVTAVEGDSKAKTEHIQALDKEINDLADEHEQLKAFEGMKDRNDKLGELEPITHPTGKKEDAGKELERKGQPDPIGDLFVKTQSFEDARKGVMNVPSEVNVEVKTLFQTSAGWAPYDFRAPTFVDYPTRPLGVADIIPKTTTNSYAITYVVEGSWTNAAVEVAEGSAKPEAALTVSTVTETVRKIAVWIPVTEEQLADVPQVREYLNNRLGFMVRQRLDTQILTGNGTAPNLKGLLNRTNIQTQAKGSDSVPDAIYKGIVKIQTVAYLEPTAVVMNPLDWQDVRLLTTADGVYIWGPPMDAGPSRIWGLPVVTTNAETQNTALVGDFNQAELAMRQGLELRVSDNYSDYFVRNLLVVLAELRAALLCYRDDAFCKVTGV